MPQNIFKIHNGRVKFWQWEVGQKLIVLDDDVTEVYFSNANMKQSITRQVYEQGGVRVCDVPDVLLQHPKNLVAYACRDGVTIKSVKFAVVKRQIPDDYVTDKAEEIDRINKKFEDLETMIDDIKDGNYNFKRFSTIQDAENWARSEKISGIIVSIYVDSKWVAHIIENDYTVTPICDDDEPEEDVIIFDGGTPAGY